ncbi:MAG: carbohydrate kinase family protein [Candidatus Bathyarchaeia archaeon]
MNYNLACIGDINWDTIIKVNRIPDPDGETRIVKLIEGVGGDAANVATAFALLGGSVLMVGQIGNDEQGRAAHKKLLLSGVDTSRVLISSDMQTGRVYSIVEEDGQRRLLHWRGANILRRLSDDDLEYVRKSEFIYIADPLPSTLRTIVEWYETGKIVSHLACDPGMATIAEGYEYVFTLLKYTTILFLNRTEAANLVKMKKLQDIINKVRSICPIVVIKLGEQGAIAVKDQTVIAKPAYPSEVVDSTGCGDAFNAAFLYRWMHTHSLEEALKWGNAAGAAVVRKLGAVMPQRSEVLQILEGGL